MAGGEAAAMVLGSAPPQAGLCISVRQKQNTELGAKKVKSL